MFRLVVLVVFAIGSVNVYGQSDENSDDSIEFAEPIFVDTSTDIGGEVGTLEINFIPGFQNLDNGTIYELGFEFEYVVFKNFGIEIEPVFQVADIDNQSSINQLSNIDLELQYTISAKETYGMAVGLELEFPVDNDLEESTFEFEPFVLFVYKTPFNLSIHPRIGAGINASEEELELNYNLAALYTFENNIVLGAELTGRYSDNKNGLLIAPQLGYELKDFFIGSGVQIPITNNYFDNNYNIILRLIYELDLY